MPGNGQPCLDFFFFQKISWDFFLLQQSLGDTDINDFYLSHIIKSRRDEMPYFGQPKGDGQGGPNGCAERFACVSIQSGRDVNGHDWPLKCIEMINDLSIITSDFRIEPRTKNSVHQDVKFF